MGLALGFKAAGGDDKFQVAIKSLTTDSETLKISARPGHRGGLLVACAKNGRMCAGGWRRISPRANTAQAHVAACEAAKAEGGTPARHTAGRARDAGAVRGEATGSRTAGVRRGARVPHAERVARLRAATRGGGGGAGGVARARWARRTPKRRRPRGRTRGRRRRRWRRGGGGDGGRSGGGVANAMTKPSDLSATNGRIILVQYAEANPPLSLNQAWERSA